MSVRLAPMTAAVRVSDHNGIRVFQADLDGVCTGTLTFGVGRSDEPATLAGITHLMEHLLLRMIGPLTINSNAHVNTDVLVIYASGTPDEVVRFLNDVGAAIVRLRELTERDLRFEKRIVSIETTFGFDDPTAGLLTYRFGLPGIGAGDFGAPGTVGITMDETVAWADRWLRAENATLAFSRELPPTLDLRLPSGPVVRTPQRDATLAAPALVSSKKSGVAISLLVPRDKVSDVQDALYQELFVALRHRRGLVYYLDTFHTALDSGITELVFVLDPLDKHINAVVRIVILLLRQLAAEGFSEIAVETARSQGRVDATRTDAALGYLDRLAEDALYGRPTRTPEEQAIAAGALTSEHLGETLAASMPSLIVAFNEDATISKKTLATIGLPVTSMSPWCTHVRWKTSLSQKVMALIVAT